jgi:hypothetical protein
MASTPPPSPVASPPVTATAPMSPTSHLAQTLPGFGPGPVINAQESNLSDYLNQPVQNTLARLGLASLPPAASNTATSTGPANPNGSSPAGAQNMGMLSSLASMLIEPVTEALGMLGSGGFGGLDPTSMFGGISQALESAGQSVQQAMGGLGDVWQGDAASAAGAQTSAALMNGTDVASQANGLSASLSAATASVQQSEAQLVAIIDQFMATLAAIGPNIIFPWGMAAAIAAASQANTMATETMTQLTSSLSAEAANATAIGSPVTVTSASQGAGVPGASASAAAASASGAAAPASALSPVSALMTPIGAALGAPAAGAGSSSALGSSLAPMMEVAGGLASPAMSGVSAATGALQSGGGQGAGQAVPAQLASSADPGQGDDPNDPNDPSHHKPTFGGGGGGGNGAIGGSPVIPAQSRLAAPVAVPETELTHAATISDADASVSTGASPMMGGAPMGYGARGGVGKSHNAAAFLHTSDQGDEIVGDLGTVAPAVIGERTAHPSADIDLTL